MAHTVTRDLAEALQRIAFKDDFIAPHTRLSDCDPAMNPSRLGRLHSWDTAIYSFGTPQTRRLSSTAR